MKRSTFRHAIDPLAPRRLDELSDRRSRISQSPRTFPDAAHLRNPCRVRPCPRPRPRSGHRHRSRWAGHQMRAMHARRLVPADRTRCAGPIPPPTEPSPERKRVWHPPRHAPGWIGTGERPSGSDDDIRINRACGPRPEQRRPCLQATPAGDLSQGAQRPDPAPWARKLGTRTPAPGPIMPLSPPGSIASARPSPASDQSAGSAHSPTITRNRIEIMFARLKDWRRIATRYNRCGKTCLSAGALAATVMFWI